MNLTLHFSLRYLLASLALTLALAGCSTIDSLTNKDSGIDYKSSKSAPKLELPPDFTQGASATRLSAARVTSANAIGTTPVAASGAPAVLPISSRVRMERNGNQRYLVVNLPAEQVYPVLTDFWKDNGFTLAIDNPQTGIMETDWAENRANLPASGLRSVLGGIFDKIVDSGLRDKYRTRIERAGSGTEIYLSHRGSKEAAAGGQRGSEVVTSARNGDVELESDFLRRIMLRFGSDEAAAKTAVAGTSAAPATPRAKMVGNAIELNDGYDAAYRRVGAALDRAGFVIDDRDVSKGEYFTRYARNLGDADKGFFSRLFGSSEKDKLAGARKVKVTVSRAANPVVNVTDDKGAAAEADISKAMIGVLFEELK